MTKLMKNSKKIISNLLFVENPIGVPKNIRNVPLVSILNVNRTFLAVKLCLLFGYKRNPCLCDLYKDLNI